MTPVDLRIYQGDNYSAQVSVFNTDGTPANIADYTAKAQIRRDVADNAKVIDCEIVCTVESPVIRLAISSTQSSVLNGNYVWDLQLVSPQGFVVTILTGRVRATPEVTRVSTSLLRVAAR